MKHVPIFLNGITKIKQLYIMDYQKKTGITLPFITDERQMY